MADKGAAGPGRMRGCLAACLMICGPCCLSENASAFPKGVHGENNLRETSIAPPLLWGLVCKFQGWF